MAPADPGARGTGRGGSGGAGSGGRAALSSLPRGTSLRASPPPDRMLARRPRPPLHAAPGIDPEHASPPGPPAGVPCPAHARATPCRPLLSRWGPGGPLSDSQAFFRSPAHASHPSPDQGDIQLCLCSVSDRGLTNASTSPLHLRIAKAVRTYFSPRWNQNLFHCSCHLNFPGFGFLVSIG